MPLGPSARFSGARTRASASAGKIRNARLPGWRGTAAPKAGSKGQDAPVQVSADDVAGASAPDGDRHERVLKPRHGRALPQ